MAGEKKGLQWWVFGSVAAMVLGALGPWVKALGQSVSGIDGANDGWLLIAAAALGGLLFYASRATRGAGIWALLGGAAGVAITLYDRNNVQHAIDQGGALTAALASVAWGLNLGLAASVSLGVAGLAWAGTQPKQAAAPLSAPTSAPDAAMPPPASPTEPPQVASPVAPPPES